ncbi:MAG: pyridoxal-dependent decarboxylase, exosortase A system-associated [Deltaproteobacteria bacterium]|nr:pyridoxal-dependent decarboxylase, exosortase A system-associated [Deltaproteobacteria bacterium]
MKDNQAVKSILQYFDTRNGKLLIGGRTCKQIADRIGTPFYAYDLGVAEKKFKMLKKALPTEVNIHYAIKANPHPEIISFFKNLGAGFDVASKGELEKVLKSGADPDTIGFAGPGKQKNEIKAACEAEIGSLNAESVTELERADKIAGNLNKKLNVSLRVNPAYELVGSGMRMGGGPKQFGIDQEKIPQVLAMFFQWKNLEFKGFHIFAGSQNLSAESISSSFKKAVEAVISFLPYCPKPPSMVNLGGGFGIPYYKNDEELDIQTVGRRLSSCLADSKSTLKHTRFVVETGRYLVGECGIYVSRIIDIKESRGETFAVIDGGMHHHLAASGNFGQVIKRNFPIILPDRLKEPPAQTINIVGPLCTPLDRLGTKVLLPEPKINDFVAVLGSGAYGYSASPLSFLSHQNVIEVVL